MGNKYSKLEGQRHYYYTICKPYWLIKTAYITDHPERVDRHCLRLQHMFEEILGYRPDDILCDSEINDRFANYPEYEKELGELFGDVYDHRYNSASEVRTFVLFLKTAHDMFSQYITEAKESVPDNRGDIDDDDDDAETEPPPDDEEEDPVLKQEISGEPDPTPLQASKRPRMELPPPPLPPPEINAPVLVHCFPAISAGYRYEYHTEPFPHYTIEKI